ncbi:MAG: FAD-binding protein, partial [Raoultibacter sp.]
VATNMYFGGIAHKKQKATGTALYTVSADLFADAVASGANDTTEIAWVAPAHPLELVASAPIQKSGVDLFKAEVVVAAGRGFAQKEDLDGARALCDALGGGLGCSRPLTEGVDWLPSEVYIGVSGLMLAPKVYVGVGISGQMQHMVGCNRATTLFAINKDKNAPIFKQCDFGLVGDINTVLPALVAAL